MFDVMDETTEQNLERRLADPQTVKEIARLLDRLESINAIFTMLESFLARGPEIADSINGLVEVLREGASFNQIGKQVTLLFTAGQKITSLVESEQVQSMLSSDVLDPESIQLIGKLARAMRQAVNDASDSDLMSKRVGLMGLVRLLGDPQVQPAINFVAALARHFSRELTSNA